MSAPALLITMARGYPRFQSGFQKGSGITYPVASSSPSQAFSKSPHPCKICLSLQKLAAFCQHFRLASMMCITCHTSSGLCIQGRVVVTFMKITHKLTTTELATMPRQMCPASSPRRFSMSRSTKFKEKGLFCRLPLVKRRLCSPVCQTK